MQMLSKDDYGETQILQSQIIETKLFTPIIVPCMFDNWDFNASVDVNVTNLELESDMV
jgi:hypothetical protein